MTTAKALNHSRMIIFVVLFALIGSSIIIMSSAATPVTSVETELGTLTGNVAMVSGVSDSGGKSVKFGSSAVASQNTLQPKAAILLTSLLNSATTKSSTTDPTYWENGIFYTNGADLSGQTTWAPYQANPAVGAAIAWRYGDHDAKWRDIAITSLNSQINSYLAADGSMTGPPNDPNTGGIEAAWFGSQLGQAYQALEPTLDAATKTKWQNTMKSIGNFLICHEYPLAISQPNPYASIDPTATCSGGKTSETRYYANGNLNLEYVDQLATTYAITGDMRYKQAMEVAYDFLVNPAKYNATQWAGYGLVITKQPTKTDGSDGAAYLVEAGAHDATGKLLVGFDPEYSHLQNQILARMYLQTRDIRFLKLLNMLTNKLLEHTNTTNTNLSISGTSWTIDMRCGTRKNYVLTKCDGPNMVNPLYTQCPAPVGHPEYCWQANGPFVSPSISILAWQGGRTDLDSSVPDQYKRIETNLNSMFVTGYVPSPGEYRWLSSSIGVLVVAANN